jgi:hypothetical protein
VATSKIQILIEADDKASAKLHAIAGGFDDMNKKAKGATKESGLRMTELNSAIMLAERAVRMMGQAYDQTIGAVINYNKAILDSSKAVGIGTEEFSRIVQVADDFGLSMQTVTTALEMATKRGFAPSVDSLASLADRVNAIASPTARAAELAKILGRNWAALDPLLQQGGAAIHELADGVEDGLVVTAKEARETEKARLAIDKWTDTVTAAKLEAGAWLVQGLMPVVEGIQGVSAAVDEQQGRMAFAAPTYEEYLRMWGEQSIAMRVFGDHMSEAEYIARRFGDALGNVGSEAHGMDRDFSAAASGIPSVLEEVSVAVEAFDPPSIWDKVFPTPAEMATKLQDQIDFIQAGGPALVGAIENVQSALAEGVITTEQAEAMLDPLSAAAEGLMVELGDVDIWQAAKDRAKEMGITFDQARDDIETGITAIGTIPAEIDIKINWIMENPVPPGGAHGLDMIVPPGFPNDSYPVRASSGERVVIIPQNTTNDNRNFVFNAGGGGDEDLLGKFAEKARRA